jgi:hypothetical protein
MHTLGRFVGRIFNALAPAPVAPVRVTGSGMAVTSNDPFRALYNPTRNLTPERVAALLDDFDQGRTTELVWLCRYAELLDPDVFCVATRVERGIQSLTWDIAPMEGASPAAAEAHAAVLKKLYSGLPNLETVLKHLAQAYMRGYAHVQIVRTPSIVLSPVDQWFMVRDGLKGPWALNPAGRRIAYTDGIPVQPMEYLIFEVPRALLRLAVLKYLKASYNARWWDRFNEICSRQGTVVIAPESMSDEAAFSNAASAIARGESGWLPYGSQLVQSNTGRAFTPYPERIRELREEFILAATGGLLTSLTAPTGLGSGVAEVQDTVWRSIIAGLAVDMMQEFHLKLDVPALAQAFPGQPPAAYFRLRTPETKNRTAVAALLKSVKDAGFKVSPETASNELGLTVTEDVPNA